MADGETLRECLQAFADRDYRLGNFLAFSLLQSEFTLPHLQLVLISFQRGGRDDLARRFGEPVLAGSALTDWDEALVKLTLGQLGPAQVLPLARDAARRCQAHYYAGARALTEGRPDEAREAFEACLAGEALCLERHLARIEHDALTRGGPPTSRPEGLIESLCAQVHRLHERGEHQKALGVAEEAADLAGATLGEDHPAHAGCLMNVALELEALGRLAEAGPLFRRALEVQRKAVGEGHPDFGVALNSLGGWYCRTGSYAEALPLFRQALGVLLMSRGQDHPHVAAVLNNLAACYDHAGDFARSEPLHRQALEVRRRALGEDHPEVADSLLGLGAVYRERGDYARAEPLFQEAVEICQKVLGERHPRSARALLDLGHLSLLKGDAARAESLGTRAAEALRGGLGGRHPDLALALDLLANAFKALGDYARAEALYQEALQARREALGDRHPLVATTLLNLADLSVELWDFPRAERLAEQALEIRRGALGEEFGATLSRLAVIYHWTGRDAEAVPLCRQALEISRAARGELHRDVASDLTNLGVVYRSLGRSAEAEPLFREALEIRRKTLGERHPDFAESLGNLAVLADSRGDYREAEPLHRQALDLLREARGDTHPDVSVGLHGLARLYVATGRPGPALPLLQQVAANDDLLVRQVCSLGSERQRAELLAGIRGNYYVFLSLTCRELGASPGALPAALDLVLRRKAVGTEVLAAQRDAVLGGRYPGLRPRLEEWARLRMRAARKALAGPGPEGPREHLRLLAEWEARRERLEAELARGIPEMGLAAELAAADRRAVALGLPEGVALVEFVRFSPFDFRALPARGERRWLPPRYLAFVLLAGDPDRVGMVDLGEAGPIDALIADFRAEVTGEGAGPGRRDLGAGGRECGRGPGDGAALRQAVFDPLRGLLAGRTRLILAPDGDLSRLPFEVLPADDGRRLIDEYQVSYVAAGRDVLRFGRAAAGQAAPPVVLADPDFDLGEGTTPGAAPAGRVAGHRQSRDLNRSHLRFGRLPGTRAEGERVAALLGVRPWLRGEALEAPLKAVRSPSVLHLATHGFFLADQPHDPDGEPVGGPAEGGLGRLSGARPENPLLRSGLALAGVNTWLRDGPVPAAAEDGLLTAEDVSGLDLLDTELVVLSACETGLGEVRVGEGVFGLRRSFVLAGARTLVMSLWKVPDEQTRELMEEFYRRILAGQPRAAALRDAQRALKAKDPDPLSWGAFICQGEPGPLPAFASPDKPGG